MDFKISVTACRLAERRGEEVEKRKRKPLGKKQGREGLGMYREERKKRGGRERELRSGCKEVTGRTEGRRKLKRERIGVRGKGEWKRRE